MSPYPLFDYLKHLSVFDGLVVITVRSKIFAFALDIIDR